MADMRWLTQGADTSDWDSKIQKATEESYEKGETGYYPKVEDDDNSFTSDEFDDYWD